MNFSTLGIQAGQQFPDISLFTLNGEKFNVVDRNPRRPKIFISGSYTCDITRTKLQSIDWLHAKYKDKADVYLINTLEAHPQNSPSPYSMAEEPWHAKDNIESGISADQPQTMQERKELAKKWETEGEIKTPILLDGPTNEFWNQVGQAPNMAVLVSPDGEVILKQSWFEREEMKNAIDNQLQQLITE